MNISYWVSHINTSRTLPISSLNINVLLLLQYYWCWIFLLIVSCCQYNKVTCYRQTVQRTKGFIDVIKKQQLFLQLHELTNLPIAKSCSLLRFQEISYVLLIVLSCSSCFFISVWRARVIKILWRYVIYLYGVHINLIN